MVVDYWTLAAQKPLLIHVLVTQQIITSFFSNQQVIKMPRASMHAEMSNNSLSDHSSMTTGCDTFSDSFSASASLSKSESNDNLMMLLAQFDHSQSNHTHFHASAVATTKPIFPREVVVLAATFVLLFFAGACFFVAPAIGISVHTFTSFWRHGMFGWTALVSLASQHLFDGLCC
jgi:hypothetical protein